MLVADTPFDAFQHNFFHQETQFTGTKRSTATAYLRPFKGATFQLFLVKAEAITFKTQDLNLPC